MYKYSFLLKEKITNNNMKIIKKKPKKHLCRKTCTITCILTKMHNPKKKILIVQLHAFP